MTCHPFQFLIVCILLPSLLVAENFGTLIFEDQFERSESQEEKDEPGNDWTTSSDKTASGHKQVDLRDGHLYVYTHKDAWHATSVRHAFAFTDGTIGLKVRFDDPADSLTLNFTDLAEKSVHAGHLFNVSISPKRVYFADLKTGIMRHEIRKAKKQNALTKQQKETLKGKSQSVTHELDVGDWHQVYATVLGDTVICSINDTEVGRFQSPGIGHETKTLLRMLVAKNAHVDDVKIWRKEQDIETPIMVREQPAPGKRVWQQAPEYRGTDVYHTLYLPTDWKAGNTYPVIVEYTGNKWPHGSGEVREANLGYGLSGGKGAIWISMPYIEKGRKKNAVTWWGDLDATVGYCKTNLPLICKQYGGDMKNLFICGFSRGAIGSSYVGLADDEIAAFWKGMFTHDHFDGHRNWRYPNADRASALKRLARLKGRPVFVSGQHAANVHKGYLEHHLDLADFTFLDVPVSKIFSIPEGKVVHAHTDLWMHRDSLQRQQARAWLKQQISALPVAPELP